MSSRASKALVQFSVQRLFYFVRAYNPRMDPGIKPGLEVIRHSFYHSIIARLSVGNMSS